MTGCSYNNYSTHFRILAIKTIDPISVHAFTVYVSHTHRPPKNRVYSQLPNKRTGMIKFYRFFELHNSHITDRRDLIQPPNDWKFAKDQI